MVDGVTGGGEHRGVAVGETQGDDVAGDQLGEHPAGVPGFVDFVDVEGGDRGGVGAELAGTRRQGGGCRVTPFGGHQGGVARFGAFQLADPAVQVVQAAEDVEAHVVRPPMVGVTNGGVFGCRSMATSRMMSTTVTPS